MGEENRKFVFDKGVSRFKPIRIRRGFGNRKSSCHKLNKNHRPKLIPKRDATFDEVERSAWGVRRSGIWENVSSRALFGFGGLCLLLAMGSLLFFPEGDVTKVAGEGDLQVLRSAEDLANAKQMVRMFCKATSIEERLALVRRPEKVEPLMRRFYSKERPRTGRLEFGDAHWEIAYERGREVLWFDYRFDDLDWNTAVFEKTREGLKLDWESFESFEEAPLADFMESPGEAAGVYRLTVRPGDYYNFQYSDQKEYQCFQVRNRQGTTCWAYARLDSWAFKELKRLFGKALDADKRKPVHLRTEPTELTVKAMLKLKVLTHTDGHVHEQALIDDFVSEHWFEL